jgi:hypothetical protein
VIGRTSSGLIVKLPSATKHDANAMQELHRNRLRIGVTELNFALRVRSVLNSFLRPRVTFAV